MMINNFLWEISFGTVCFFAGLCFSLQFVFLKLKKMDTLFVIFHEWLRGEIKKQEKSEEMMDCFMEELTSNKESETNENEPKEPCC